jgi:hypothetical protein
MKKLSLLNTRVNINVFLIERTDLDIAQDQIEGSEMRCVQCLEMPVKLIELEVGRAPDENRKDLAQVRFVLESDYMCVPCFEKRSGGPLPAQDGEEVGVV